MYVYMVTNHNNKSLYTGVTKDIQRRLFEHRNPNFYHIARETTRYTERYNCYKLVYFEFIPSPVDAIAREKEIKGWKRDKKDALVNLQNPAWKDLGYKVGLPI